MKKKFILLLILALMLTGCAQQSKDSLSDQLSSVTKRAIKADIPDYIANNCKKTYYTYYLNSNIGKSLSDEVSNQFIINGNLSGLSLDPTSIVENKIYTDTSDDKIRRIGEVNNVLFSQSGLFENSSLQKIPYTITVTQLNDNTSFILIQTSQFIFISHVSEGTCANTLYDMLILLRTATVDENKVVLDFASDNVVVTTTSIITLFNDVIPESGYIADYMDDWKENTNFIVIDNTPKENENEIIPISDDSQIEDLEDLEIKYGRREKEKP